MLIPKSISMIFEGLEIQLFNVFIAIAAAVIVYFAWKSTYVRDIPPPTVLIIENSRRRLLENIVRPHFRITDNLSESRNQSTNHRSDIFNNIRITAPSLQDVLEEVSDLAMSGATRTNSSLSTGTHSERITENNNDNGPQEIIRNMDNTIDEEIARGAIRRRRIPFYTQNAVNENNTNEINIRRENLNLQISGDSTHAENCSNENNENENKSKSESNRNQNDQAAGSNIGNEINNGNSSNSRNNDEFVIKLKYLNDDLRLVKGSPHEALGDFKKRNFTVELASEKLVRLVFNGHVLQPDTKTLQAFGLFNNCVVHCLVHKKSLLDNTVGGSNAQQGHSDNQTTNNAQHRNRNANGSNFRSGLTNGPLFVYFAVGATSLAILFSWYCRFQYSSLFSLYSTIGLIFMTVLFLLIFPLIILIERDVTV